MMDLILWRHAEADDAEPGQDDLLRPLSARGRKQARRMSPWLEQFLPESCRILVSPALRTVQTAESLGRKFKLCPDIAPGATAQGLLDAANWPASRSPVLLVGHQPALGEAASLLITGSIGPLAVRKGCVWWISSRDDGRGNVLRAVACPELARQ